MAKSRSDDAPARRRPVDDEDDGPPRRRGPADDDDDDDEAPDKPRRKRKSAAGPAKLVLRIIAGVAGAILLFILLYWIYTPVGIDDGLFCYFPPETVRLTGYDASEGNKINKLKEVNQTIVGNYNVFGEPRFKNAPVQPIDVDKYLSGVAAGDPEQERDLAPQDKRGSLTVVRFNKSVDPKAFHESFVGEFKSEEVKRPDGKTYYQLWRLVPVRPDNHLEREDDISYFFPKSDVLVYATTRRELEEAMNRQPGKVVVKGNMRDLADKMDGHFFQCSTGWYEFNGMSNAMAFGLGFVDEEFRDMKSFSGVTGSASWFASNGNNFLYASATMYADKPTAKRVLRGLDKSFYKAQADIYENDSGIPGGLEDPWNPKPKAGQPPPIGGGPSGDETKDIMAGLAAYSKSARVYRRDRLVIVEGMIPHGTPEQGVFEKFWKAVGPKFSINRGQNFFPGAPMAPGPGGPGMQPGVPPL